MRQKMTMTRPYSFLSTRLNMGEIENQKIFEEISNGVITSIREHAVEKGMFWDIYEPLSHNCLFNFIVGNRGGGKTYGAKQYAMKEYFKCGSQFIYMRRSQVEVISSAKHFFDDLIESYPGYTWKYKGGEFFIASYDAEKDEVVGSWQVVGHALNLSTASNRKSISYPKVGVIIFDEFILTPTGKNRYLPDEVSIFLDAYETIARMRDVKVFFLSNALTIFNPYFIFFNIKIPTNSRMIGKVRKDILIQMVVNEKYVKAKKATRFGGIIENTKYESYAILNNFLLDDNTMIKKKTGRLTYVCTFQYMDDFFGLYMDYQNQQYYLSQDVDFNQKMVIRTVLPDGKLNPLTLKNRSKLPEIKMLVYSFVEGSLYFESQTIKHKAKEMIGRLM